MTRLALVLVVALAAAGGCTSRPNTSYNPLSGVKAADGGGDEVVGRTLSVGVTTVVR